MVFSTVLAWAAWIMILFFVDPASSGLPVIVFFYASLGLAITGTMSILGLMLRTRWNHEELVSRLVSISFRQGIWMALAAISALVLQSFGALKWWILLIIIGILAIIELFCLSVKRRE
jgi:hypothetical protein